MERLFTELKRRNVFRVAATYLVAAWVIAQVSGLAADAFEAPAWVMQMIITGVVIGFVPAVIFAWVFEITPEGIKRERELAEGRPDAAHTSRKLDIAVIILLVAAIGLLLGDRFLFQHPAPTPTVAEATGKHWQLDSIAVLPFADFSPARDQAWLGEGIAETLLHALAQVEGLRVSARTSSFAYRDRAADVATIGRELGVATVLEGSVQRAGDRLRIVAQLVRTDTQDHIFSRTFDRGADDIFAIQDEIAAAVAEALTGTTQPQGAGLARTDVDVYDLYLEGRQLWQERTRDAVHLAVERLELAVELDPQYAPARSELATALLFRHLYGDTDLEDDRSAIERHLRRALELDPNDAQAWATRGLLFDELHLRSEGLDALLKAEELAPSDANIQAWLGNRYYDTAHFAEAASHFERALELDPLNRWVRGRYITVLGMLNPEDPRIERIARDTVRLFPEHPTSWIPLLNLLSQRGQVDELALVGFEAHRKHPGELSFAWFTQTGLAALDLDDAASAWLERIRQIDPDAQAWSMSYLRSDPERHLALAREEYERWGDQMLANLFTSLRVNRRFDEAWELSEHHLAAKRAAFESGEAGVHDYNLLIEGMWLARRMGDDEGYLERYELFMPRYDEIRASEVFSFGYTVPDLILAVVSGDHDSAAELLADVPASALGTIAWAVMNDPMFEPIREHAQAARLVERHESGQREQRERLLRDAPPELTEPALLPPVDTGH
jgi:TolB-like protein